MKTLVATLVLTLAAAGSAPAQCGPSGCAAPGVSPRVGPARALVQRFGPPVGVGHTHSVLRQRFVHRAGFRRTPVRTALGVVVRVALRPLGGCR